jgi:CheY-like chemotaxis protein
MSDRPAETSASAPRPLPVDEFLATLSHELRTPLTPLRAGLELLKARVDPGLLPTVEAMERNLAQETRLIDTLLDVARLNAGQLTLDRRPVDLAACLRGAVEETAPAAGAREQSVLLDLPQPLPHVLADAGRLQRAFTSLLDNAIKFSPPRGRITVTVTFRPAKRRVKVRVTDSGPGIDPALLPHLFKPFRQADGSSRRRHGGLGLGLAVAARVVGLHGGKLRATNLPTGGARFTCTLPVLETEPAAPPPAAAPPPRLRVLLVDDSLDTVQILGRLLAMKGLEVREAADVDQALTRLLEETPDVIVTDIGMPDRDGYDLLRLVRADRRLSHVPVIAATGYVSRHERERMAAVGFAAALTKPFDLAELLETFERVCPRK